jgi:hypothetical protein
MEHTPALSNLPRASALKTWADSIRLAQRATSELMDIASSPIDLLKIDGDSGVTDESPALIMSQSNNAIQSLIDRLKSVQLFARRIRNTSRRIVPIHALPIELLKTIFEYGHNAYTLHPSDPDFNELGANISYQFRSSISLVCHQWRSVSLETRRLWAHINLNKKWPLECVETYLERSLPSALNILISLDQSSPPAGWNESAQLLISNFYRWRSCGFQGEKSLFVDILSKADDVEVNKMEYISFYHHSPKTIANDGLWDTFWNNLANLLGLSLLDTLFPWSAASLDHMLGRLLHLDLFYYPKPSGDTLELVLTNCHQLQSFRIWSYKSMNRVETIAVSLELPAQNLQVARITLSNLRSLSVRFNSPACLRQIFRTILAPQLITLDIDPATMGSRSIPEVIAFINESGLSLRTLSLYELSFGSGRDPDDLRSLLVHSPSLEVVHFFHRFEEIELQSAVGPDNSDGKCPCPNLREIHLHDIKNPSGDFNPLMLANIVESRAKSGDNKTRSPVRMLDFVSVTTAALPPQRQHFSNIKADEAIERLGRHAKEVKWAFRESKVSPACRQTGNSF